MSLYNEVRPLCLRDVKGQDNIKTQLAGMFQSGNVPHGLLLVGPRGTGKTTVARIIAKFLNCDDPKDGEPCNECDSCRSILKGTNPDVTELDAASNNGVEDVHRITESAQFTPVGKHKIFILDEVHMFSNSAWNALLKILEEPPKGVYFILCTTEEQKIPATIISRCCKLHFEKISLEVVVSAMEEICQKYGKAYDLDALKLIARASEGCMRDALSILEAFFDTDSIITDAVSSALGLSQEDVIFSILCGIQEGDVNKALSALSEASTKGVSLAKLVKGIIGAVVDAMYITQGASVDNVLNTESYKRHLDSFSKSIRTEKCMELVDKLSDVYGALSKSDDAQFLLETALIQSVNYESELASLKNRVEKLEKGLQSASVEYVAKPLADGGQEQGASYDEQNDKPTFEENKGRDSFDGFTDAEDSPFAEDELPDFTDSESVSGVVSNDVDPAPLNSSPVDEIKGDVFDRLPEGTVVNTETANIFNFTDHVESKPQTESVVTDNSDKTAGTTPFFSMDAEGLPPMDDGLPGFLWQ